MGTKIHSSVETEHWIFGTICCGYHNRIVGKIVAEQESYHFCDNKSVVEMINQSVCGCLRCMALIRVITLTSIRNNVRFFAIMCQQKRTFWWML